MKYRYGVLQRRNYTKHFGVTAMCGVVLVGSSPVVANAAFADSVPGTKHNIRVELTSTTARDANIPKDLGNKTDSTALVTPKESQAVGYPTLTMEGTSDKFGTSSTRVFTDQLGFTEDQNQNPTENTIRCYMITLQTPSPEQATRVVTYDKAVCKLEWHCKIGMGTLEEQKRQGTWDYRLKKFVEPKYVDEGDLRDADKEPEIAFENTYHY